MKLKFLEVLSESEIKDIHVATIDILEHCGVKVLSPKILTKSYLVITSIPLVYLMLTC